jgi:pyruvate/2-oxoglutarate dehydrogenase complex dihydrolipoamide acyltransferase (E2) component
VDDAIEIREYLHVTLIFNNDVVDGAPAARFTGRLNELVKTGYCLDGIDK